MGSRLVARPMHLAGAGQWGPVRRDGLLGGYLSAALRQGSLLHEPGFQEGASVLAVAGTPAWRPALLLAVAPSLALADQVVVTVLRGRRQREVVFAVI